MMTKRLFGILFGFILVIAGTATSAGAQDYLDSLETKLILVENEHKLTILNELIPHYFRNDPLKAQQKADKLLTLSIEVGNKNFEYKALRYLAESHTYLNSDHELSLKKMLEVEKNAKQHGFMEEYVLSKLAIGDIFLRSGHTSKAIDYQLNALQVSDSMNFGHLEAMILNSLSSTYIQLEEGEKAQSCLKQALRLAKFKNQETMIAQSHMLFGDMYTKHFNQALGNEHYSKALDIYQKSKNRLKMAEAYFKMGNGFLASDEITAALQNHIKALNLRMKINDVKGLAESFNQMGSIYLQRGEIEKAISHISSGLNYAQSANSNLDMQDSYDLLYQVYLDLDDFKNAIKYKNRYVEISELIFSEADEMKLQEIHSQYEIERKEEEILLLSQINEQKEKKLAASRNFNITLGILLVVFVGFVVMIVRSYRDKRRMNSILKERNQLVSKQNIELKDLNDTKDKFFSIIAHDLKGPLNSLTAFSQLLINHTAELSEKEIRTIAKDLDLSLKNLFELLENLLGWARSQTGGLTLESSNFNLSSVVIENARLLRKAAINKKIRIEMRMEEDLEVYADINAIRTVLRNLISNSIKFTNEEGLITINAEQKEDEVEIIIEDNGVGMTPETQNKIFDITRKHSTLGTNKEKGTGLGLILCKEFVEQNQGNILVKSKEGVGTAFKIVLPARKDILVEEPIEVLV